MMPAAVYLLCALTSFACAVLLARGWLRSHARLLLWSSLCFAGLFINNAALFIDMIVWTNVDLTMVRSLSALAGMSLLLYGLVWEAE